MLIYEIDAEDAQNIIDEIKMILTYSLVFDLVDPKIVYHPHNLSYFVNSKKFSFSCSDHEEAHSVLLDYSRGVMIV